MFFCTGVGRKNVLLAEDVKSQRFVEHSREDIYHDYHFFSSNYRKVLRILMNLNVPLYRLSRANVLLIEYVKIYKVRGTLLNKKNTTTAVGVLN